MFLGNPEDSVWEDEGEPYGRLGESPPGTLRILLINQKTKRYEVLTDSVGRLPWLRVTACADNAWKQMQMLERHLKEMGQIPFLFFFGRGRGRGWPFWHASLFLVFHEELLPSQPQADGRSFTFFLRGEEEGWLFLGFHPQKETVYGYTISLYHFVSHKSFGLAGRWNQSSSI